MQMQFVFSSLFTHRPENQNSNREIVISLPSEADCLPSRKDTKEENDDSDGIFGPRFRLEGRCHCSPLEMSFKFL